MRDTEKNKIQTTEKLKTGIYVHWPFCTRICPYCDFNVYKNRTIDEALWRDALVGELRYWAEQIPERQLTSLYFGGGTPALAPLPIIAEMIETCEDLWGFVPGAEITIEVNPGEFTKDKQKEFAQIGINRASIGVQSFNDDYLKFLGRDHSGNQARRAVEASAACFQQTTFDLIYGLPMQTPCNWENELSDALKVAGEHISLYQLTIEPGTAFAHAVRRGDWALPDVENLACFFDIAVAKTVEFGYEHYEISNFAKQSARARHNLLYWQYQDYIGIGPGAHGRITLKQAAENHYYGHRIATQTYMYWQDYLNHCKTHQHGVELREILSPEAQRQERYTMGLRLVDGLFTDSDKDFFGAPARAKRMKYLEHDGLLVRNDNHLCVSQEGRAVLDAILLEIFKD